MGRRNRKRKSFHENDDAIERLHFDNKKVKTIINDNDGMNVIDSSSNDSSPNVTGTKRCSSTSGYMSSRNNNCSNDNTTTGTKISTSTKSTSPDDRDNKDNKEIIRLRHKKRQKQKLQKLKKEKQQQTKLQNENLIKKHKLEQSKVIQEKQKEQKEIVKKLQNKNDLKFITTHRGVQYCDILIGKGPVIQDRKRITVNYKLHAHNLKGKVIDSHPNFSFKYGKGEVIPGWEIGLLRMRQGGVRHLIIPPNAGYGNRNIGAGVGGLLYFEIRLLGC